MLPKELGHLEKDEKRNTEINSKKYLSHLPKPKEVFFAFKFCIRYIFRHKSEEFEIYL